MPAVSILVPVYNREYLIGECIQSALAQTYSDFELVIIDNASIDGTWKICQKFSVADNRVRLFQNSTNIGPLKNIISGIKQCKGKYIKILFSDDLLTSDCLEKSVAALELNPEGAMLIGNIYPLVNSQIIYRPLYRFDKERISTDEYVNSVMFADAMPLSPGACLFRREDIERNYKSDIQSPIDRKIEDHGAGPDLLSMLLTAARYDYICLMNQPVNIFREHEGSLSISKSGKRLSDCYVQAKVNFAVEYFSQSELRKVVAYIYTYRCVGYKEIISPLKFIKEFGLKLSNLEIILLKISIVKLVLRKIANKII